jgi:hypothetical protein
MTVRVRAGARLTLPGAAKRSTVCSLRSHLFNSLAA